MQHMLDYVDAHIAEKLDTAALAGEAHYSPVQLTRRFIETTGHSPAQYILRRKLFFAGRELNLGNEKIVDIAMKYGFESHDVFTRAFKRVYRRTPEEFRRKGCYPAAFFHPQGGAPDEPGGHLYGAVEIVTLPQTHLIGIERKFRAPEQAWEVFGRVYDDVFRSAPGRVHPHSRNATHVLSILQPGGDFTIFAGIEVTDLSGVPKGADVYTLPEQEHAVLCFEGGLDYREVTDFLYEKWLGKSGYQSGQTKAYPIATVEYYTPSGVEPYAEAVYVPILPVVPAREACPPARVYALTVAESDHPCRQTQAVERMLAVLREAGADMDAPLTLRLRERADACEVFYETGAVLTHPALREEHLPGGSRWRVETCSRCPHIARAAFERALRERQTAVTDWWTVYHLSGGGLQALTPMWLEAACE